MSDGPAYMVGIAHGALAAVVLWWAFFAEPGTREVQELTDAQRKQYAIRVDMPIPFHVELQFVDPGMIEKGTGDRMAYAYTEAWRNPCQIIMPATVIYARPAVGEAMFEQNGGWTPGEVLAHEVLHCLRGRWHPSWKKIAQCQMSGDPLCQ